MATKRCQISCDKSIRTVGTSTAIEQNGSSNIRKLLCIVNKQLSACKLADNRFLHIKLQLLPNENNYNYKTMTNVNSIIDTVTTFSDFTSQLYIFVTRVWILTCTTIMTTLKALGAIVLSFIAKLGLLPLLLQPAGWI